MARLRVHRPAGWPAGWSVMAVLAGLGAPATASGQAPAPDVPSATDDSGQLQDIVVTAERRETKLQKTPIAVSAFTAEDLRQQSASDVAAIAAQTPNAEFSIGSSASGSPNVSAIFIRGIGQTDFLSTTDPGVGLYVDGVYVSRQVGNVLDLQDVARIEVLRGPQGTLFGKNTVGGAINVVTTTPGPELVARAEATYGSYNRVELRDMISGSLADGLFGKASIAYKRVDGYGDRLSYPDGSVTGNQGGLEDVIGRFGLRAVPAEDVIVDLSFDFIRNRDESVVNQGLLSNPASPLLRLFNTFSGAPFTQAYANPGRYDNYETGPNFSDQDVYGGSVTVQWFPSPALTVKSITGYRYTSSGIGRDGDGAPPVVLDAIYGLDDYEATEELQFSGASLDGRLNWLGGLYYLHEHAKDTITSDILSGLYAGLQAVAPSPDNLGLDLDILNSSLVDIDSYAAFTQESLAVTDRLTLTAGLRYTIETKTDDAFSFRRVSETSNYPPTKLSGAYYNLSPKFGVDYQVTPDLLAYASASEGFKSGGFNGHALTAASFNGYGPEKVWSYEVGVKSEWLDHRLRLNLAAFYNDYKDIQITVVAPGTVNALVENAGTATIKGVEAELVALPLPDLRLTGSTGFQYAEYTSLSRGATVTLSDRLPYAPRWTTSFSAEYTLPVGRFGDLTLRGDVSWRSKEFTEPDNSDLTAQRPYSLWGLRTTFAPAGSKFRVAFFVKNLTDIAPVTNGLDASGSFGLAERVKGLRPREFGGTLSYDF